MRAQRLVALTWLLALVASCAPKPQASAQRAAAPVPGIGAVAVVPFRVGGELNPDAAFTEKADATSGVPDDLGDQAAAVLADRLTVAGITVADANAVRRATPVGGTAVYDAALGARVAKAVGAEFAVIGAITRYVEREGSDWGVTVPATVWYQAVLVRALDGGVAARERFEYTQQPLTANLLELPRFLQGGGRWRTRRELLDGALGETAEKFATRLRTGR
ncbi:MAG TPA: hypothetical protein VGR62_16305 [Candidatus Binatia bacterium]|jgi:hypothetical protein|nr:hypothetical protein [Candidatus Binatia bacterium]